MSAQHQLLRVVLQPRTLFATPFAGDTLFGQVCWGVRERYGNEKLAALLAGYTAGEPFLVVSNGYPAQLKASRSADSSGDAFDIWVSKPTVPHLVNSSGTRIQARERKALKRKSWLAISDHALPFPEWLNSATELPVDVTPKAGLVTQNAINRLTGTTGSGDQFAPRQVKVTGYGQSSLIAVFIALDSAQFTQEQLKDVLEDIGAFGYGKDATVGMGKFDILDMAEHEWLNTASTQAITLAPCAPVADELDVNKCFYQPLTRFGRHGNQAARATGEGGFVKSPVLLMDTHALLAFKSAETRLWHGQGLGGKGKPISQIMSNTVMQGYAPLLPINSVDKQVS